MSRLSLLLRRENASSSAEFALVLPLLILFLLGIIDVGRYMWSLNKIEKATQMGVRMAVVTAMVPDGLATQNYGTTLGQGNPIPTSSFGAATCQKPSGTVTCTCTT
jgi:Flp pilus assembly protein TadG